MMYSSREYSDPELVKNDPKNPDFYPLVRKDEDGKKYIIPPPTEDWRVSLSVCMNTACEMHTDVVIGAGFGYRLRGYHFDVPVEAGTYAYCCCWDVDVGDCGSSFGDLALSAAVTPEVDMLLELLLGPR